MPRIVYPSAHVTETIHAIIATRALPVHWHYVHMDDCTVCSGFDPLCAACHGTGQQRRHGYVVVSGLVQLGELQAPEYVQVGRLLDGNARLIFAYPLPTVVSGYWNDTKESILASGVLSLLRPGQLFMTDTHVFEYLSHTFDGRPYNRLTVLTRIVGS